MATKDPKFDIKPDSCQAYWRENGKCSDWEKGIGFKFRCFKEEEEDIVQEEGFIELKFKFAIDFDSITPSNPGANAGRYKLKEITDEEAYKGGLMDDALKGCDFEYDEDKTDNEGEPISKEEQSIDKYYECLECLSPETGYTWKNKKIDYGDVYLICKELWWTEPQGGGVGPTYFATENDACYTIRGLSKGETDDRLYEKGEKLNVFNNHGPHVVPACYGLPDFKGTEFEDPIWQREDPDTSCQPPKKNKYAKDENGEDTDELGLTYQIFWHGGGSGLTLEKYTDTNIKNGRGDYPGNNGIFWNAIPNEEYELSIRHNLYVFPDFIREDDGTPVVGVPEFGLKYQDIRDFLYTDVNDAFNPPIDGQAPYREGCDCGSAEEGSSIPDDPFADINLNYLAGMQPDYTESPRDTQRIKISSAELFNLSFCSPTEYIRTIEFDGIRPTTLFKVYDKDKDDYLKMSSDKYADYIQHGQYSVFHVSFNHKSNSEHPNTTTTGCHDQVSYHFAFAMNLKDILKETGEPNPKLYTGEGVSPERRAIKLYHPSMKTADISAELEYPGELWVKESAHTNPEHPRQDGKPRKQCIYLEVSPKHRELLYGAEDLELPPNAISTHRGIAEGVLGPDFFFGGQHSTVGLTLLSPILEAGEGYPRDSGFIEQSTLLSVHNLHLKLGWVHDHNKNAIADLRTGPTSNPWSHFGSGNPED